MDDADIRAAGFSSAQAAAVDALVSAAIAKAVASAAADAKRRQREIDVQKVLALWVPITFILHVGVWSFVPIPNIGNDKVIGMLQAMLGAHMAWAGGIVAFYFSNTASSAKKDDIIAKSTPIEAARDMAVAAVQAAATPTGTNGAAEAAAWSDALSKNTKQGFEEYLTKFPSGLHAMEARSRAAS